MFADLAQRYIQMIHTRTHFEDITIYKIHTCHIPHIRWIGENCFGKIIYLKNAQPLFLYIQKYAKKNIFTPTYYVGAAQPKWKIFGQTRAAVIHNKLLSFWLFCWYLGSGMGM